MTTGQHVKYILTPVAIALALASLLFAAVCWSAGPIVYTRPFNISCHIPDDYLWVGPDVRLALKRREYNFPSFRTVRVRVGITAGETVVYRRLTPPVGKRVRYCVQVIGPLGEYTSINAAPKTEWIIYQPEKNE